MSLSARSTLRRHVTLSFLYRGVMKRRHIAIFTESGNGHVYPVLPLCSELVKRGHCVTYATSDHYARKIREAGAEPVIFSGRSPNIELQEEIKKTFLLSLADPAWWKMLNSFQIYRFAFTEEILPRLQRYYQERVPDLILYDRYMIAGRILARSLNCATIQISPHFAQYRKSLYRENGAFRNPEPESQYARALDSFLLTHGITTADNLWHAENLNIHFIPREFQYGNESFDERFCFVGALLNRPCNPTWTNYSNGRPIILVSDLSGLRDALENTNSTGYFKLLVDALSGIGCHCILSIGDNVDPHSLGSLPANFEINQRASHLEILPHAALSVCHGGMLSTLEALYNGVPVLALPAHQGAEEVAYRTAELGLGIQLSRNTLTIQQVKETIEAMIGDTLLQNRVKEMQRLFGHSGGALLAADRIEESLGQ